MPDKPNIPANFPGQIHETAGGGIVLSKLDDIVNWARSNSLWPLTFATSCCGIEMMAVASSKYDFSDDSEWKHTIKYNGLLEAKSILGKNMQFYFVVPEYKYDSFMYKQAITISDGQETVMKWALNMKQYVLKVDLDINE